MKNNDKCYILGIAGEGTDEDSLFLSSERITEGLRELIEAGMRYFICVMNEPGVFIADALWNLQREYDGLQYETVIPYEEISVHWSEEMRDIFFSTVHHSVKETMFTRRPYPGFYGKLIDGIINGSNHVVALYI